MTSSVFPITIRNQNEMIIIDLNNNVNIGDNQNGNEGIDDLVDHPTDVIDAEQDSNFFCCPSEFIYWDEPHGLLNYNLPWFPKRTSARDWFIDKRNRIRIPDKHKIIPSYLFFIPCVWLHTLIIFPFMEANSILLYIDNHQLKLQLHQKRLCSEIILQPNNVSAVVIAHVQVRTSQQKEIRLCIILSNGERSIKTQWLPYHSITNSKMSFLRDTINNYVNNYTIYYELASSTPTIATSSSNHGRVAYYPIVADAKIVPTTDHTLNDFKEDVFTDDDNIKHIGDNSNRQYQIPPSQVMSR